MKNPLKIILIAMLLLIASLANAASTDPVLQAKTLGAIYIDAAAMFSFYSGQAAELVKPENSGKLAEMQKQLQGYANLQVDLSGFFKKIDDFAKNEIFVPDGTIWFTIDSTYHPTLAFKARVKPLEFVEYLEAQFGKIQQPALKRDKELVEYSLPTPEFKMTLSITPAGLYLHSDGAAAEAEDTQKWGDLLKNVNEKKALLLAEVDLNQVKRLIAGKSANTQHSICFSNLRILTGCCEMYAMDHEGPIKVLDQQALIAGHYLKGTLNCPDKGVYSMKADEQIACSIHGSIDQPAKTADLSSENSIPAQFRPFEIFRLRVLKDSTEAALMLNDKNTVEQWAAIGKQQLLAIKNMAQNQMGQLPESERQKGLKMLDAVKINNDDQWLRLSVEGLDEQTMISGITGFIGAAAAIAIPNFQKSRDLARSKACDANCRVLIGAIELMELETGKPCESLDIKALIDGQYLKSEQKCPDGGTYSLSRGTDGISIKCSHHQAD